MGTEAIDPWSKTSLFSDTRDHPAAHSMTEKMANHFQWGNRCIDPAQEAGISINN
jgi:hypothetical protein